MTSIEALRMRGSGGNSSGAVLDALVNGMPVKPNTDESVFTNRLHPKANHTFTIRKDTEYYISLRESIRENGVQTPLLVRRHPSIPGDYEIISGHTRHALAQEFGIEQLPIRVAELDDADADILMAETNIQRPDWLPSEKAHTFTVWLEAVRKKSGVTQGQRTDLTSATELPKLRNRDLAAAKWGISGQAFELYIKLNDLSPALLSMVDTGRITVKAGYQLAFLCEEDQRVVYNTLASLPGTILKEDPAKALRAAAQDDYLMPDTVREALGLLEKEPKTKTVSFSLSADAFDDIRLAKKYKKDAAFQTAMAAWIRSYIENRESGERI